MNFIMCFITIARENCFAGNHNSHYNNYIHQTQLHEKTTRYYIYFI